MSNCDTFSNIREIEGEIYDIYLDLKTKISSGEILIIDEGKEKLKEIKMLTILKYLRENISILINIKCEEAVKKFLNENDGKIFSHQEEYEKLLIKLEAEIREHIKVEYQMKLHNEYLESKIQDYEEMAIMFEEMQKKIEKYERKINADDYSMATDKKHNEILILKAENSNLKNILKSLEEKIKILNESEEKYENLKKQSEKDFLSSNQIIEKLNKKLLAYEKALKSNNNNNTSVMNSKVITSKELKEKSVEFKVREFSSVNIINSRSISSGARCRDKIQKMNLNKSDITKDTKDPEIISIKGEESATIPKTHRKIISVNIIENGEIKDNINISGSKILNNSNNSKIKVPVNFNVTASHKNKNLLSVNALKSANCNNANILNNTNNSNSLIADKKFMSPISINTKIFNLNIKGSSCRKVFNAVSINNNNYNSEIPNGNSNPNLNPNSNSNQSPIPNPNPIANQFQTPSPIMNYNTNTNTHTSNLLNLATKINTDSSMSKSNVHLANIKQFVQNQIRNNNSITKLVTKPISISTINIKSTSISPY